MWRAIIIALALVVVVQHGTPMVGEAMGMPAAPAYCQGSDCAAQHHSPQQDGMGTVMLCIAVLAVAVIASEQMLTRRGMRMVPLRRAFGRARMPAYRGPPAHGPPRPLRPCVLLR